MVVFYLFCPKQLRCHVLQSLVIQLLTRHERPGLQLSIRLRPPRCHSSRLHQVTVDEYDRSPLLRCFVLVLLLPAGTGTAQPSAGRWLGSPCGAGPRSLISVGLFCFDPTVSPPPAHGSWLCYNQRPLIMNSGDTYTLSSNWLLSSMKLGLVLQTRVDF